MWSFSSALIAHQDRATVYKKIIQSIAYLNFYYYLCIVIKIGSIMQWLNEREKLEELINQGLSYDEIGKMYNVSGAAIRKAAPRIGIQLPRRRKINPKETFNKGTAQTATCIYLVKPLLNTHLQNIYIVVQSVQEHIEDNNI